MPPTKAVILLSGGLDSSTVLYRARQRCDCYTLAFDYRQRHRCELDAAARIAAAAGAIAHRVVRFDLSAWGGSALTDAALSVPRDRSVADMAASIPITYVPARNTIFLSFALGYAEAVGAQEVHLGVNALDYSGYPDCRPDYLDAMREVYRLGTRQGREGEPIAIVAPLIDLKKTEIVALGDRLGVPWEHTWSCYEGGERACGTCDACRLRLAAFAELGRRDPLPYATET